MPTMVAVVPAGLRLDEEIFRLKEILRLKGGLWEDQKIRLATLEEVASWIEQERRATEQALAEEREEREMEERAKTPEVKYKDTRALFDSYRDKKRR